MMLLQAGQLGLYRRDSIWTDELPPDMLPGATSWIDGTDSSTLFPNIDATGTNVTADGASVLSAINKFAMSEGVTKWYGTTTLKNPAISGNSALKFGVVAPTSMIYCYYNDPSGGSGFPQPSSLFTASAKLIVAVVKVNSAEPAGAYPFYDAAIFKANGGFFGLTVVDTSDPSGYLMAQAHNESATGINVASRLFPRSEFVVLTFSHQSNQVRVRVNGGAWSLISSGATTRMDSAIEIGSSNSEGGSTVVQGSDMEIAHIVTSNAVQADGAISALEHWLALDVGITPWW